MQVRTRMAPSPTGEFHIGGMRTLLYNYALARKEKGKFILRIEDTDRERFVEGATERLVQVIKDYGLNWDEGPEVGGPYAPYIQSQRLDIYQQYAEQLVASGHAYYCFCSKERLDQLRDTQREAGAASTRYDKHCLSLNPDEVKSNLSAGKPYVIRLNVPANQVVSFEDKVLGTVSFPTNDVDDQVLLKSDGFPTYHLAVVVDDHLMNLNYVMRGVEWLPSTSKHVLLYNAFGWEIPTHAHIPLLKEQGSTKKLSKRMGSVAATEFLAEGYLPEALLNFLMFLGWNPGTEKEIYTLDEFINDFSVEKIHKTDLVVFDRTKLLWMNGYYIRNMSDGMLLNKIKNWSSSFLVKVPGEDFSTEYQMKVLSKIKDRMKTLADYTGLSHYFYEFVPLSDLNSFSEFSESPEKAHHILQKFYEKLESVETSAWNYSELDVYCHNVLAESTYKPKEAFMTLRLALTSEKATPHIFDVMEILGKEESLKRLKYYLHN